jgi:hypothetical protein
MSSSTRRIAAGGFPDAQLSSDKLEVSILVNRMPAASHAQN